MKIAIVGGTGAFGRALAKRLRALGYDVHVGSRDAARGRELVRAPVASGLQSLSAAHLAAAEPPDEDAFVCGDPRAKQPALELADGLVGGRAVDAGPLENSRALEAMTAVILNVNREYGIT